MATKTKKKDEEALRRERDEAREEAATAYKKAYETARHVFQSDRPSSTVVRGVASVLLSDFGEFVEQHFTAARRVAQEHFGPGVTEDDVVAVSDVLLSEDSEAEAVAVLREAVETARHLFGSESVDAETAFAVGSALMDEDGEDNLAKSITAVRSLFGAATPPDAAFDYYAFVYADSDD